MTVSRSTERTKRVVSLLVCMPIIVMLILMDAFCAAWQEFKSDIRDSVHLFVDAWRDKQ